MTRKRASRKEEGHWAPALRMYYHKLWRKHVIGTISSRLGLYLN